jgi:hypothetical protein
MNNQSIVSTFKTFHDAEDAVRELRTGGIAMEKVSIIGRDWQVREDVQGFYTPKDAAGEGAKQGAWLGGIFGLMMGAGLFLLPFVGPLIVLGPLAGLMAGAVAGAGIGALVSGLVALGIPKEEAIKYQSRLEAGEFLVLVHGTPEDMERAHQILKVANHTELKTHALVAA